MTTALKLRRGTTSQHSTFTGAEGEVTVDTTKDTVVVHDGATAGGFPLLKEANPSYTGTLTGGTGVVNLGSGQFVKDASGNIGVGLAPVSGYGKFQVRNSYVYVNEEGSDIKQMYLRTEYGGQPAIQIATNHPLIFATNNIERIRIPSNAGGITFPATQSASSNANTLDDYEEGTFTPIVTSGGGSITSYTSNGYYTKVGNVVTITCAFFINNAGTASGSAGVTLPFTSATVSLYGGNRTCCFFVREDSATGINFQGILGSNSATAALFALNSTAGISWTNGYSYNLCFSYLASN